MKKWELLCSHDTLILRNCHKKKNEGNVSNATFTRAFAL